MGPDLSSFFRKRQSPSFFKPQPAAFKSPCLTATRRCPQLSRNTTNFLLSSRLEICREVFFPSDFRQLTQKLPTLAWTCLACLFQYSLCPPVTLAFCYRLFLPQLCDPGLSVDVTRCLSGFPFKHAADWMLQDTACVTYFSHPVHMLEGSAESL